MEKILRNRIITNGILEPIDLKCDGQLNPIRVTDDYIDISYKSKETPARVLSNLYPYQFNYFGFPVNSIEAVIQSLKYQDKKIRETCYSYAGIDAWHLRGMTPYDWQQDGILYTPSGEINRFSNEYQDFIDGVYASILDNPLYCQNLLQSNGKELDHMNGEDNEEYTTLTRTEYISRLYALRECLIQQATNRNEVLKALKRVRTEL